MKKILTTLILFSVVTTAFAQTHNEQVTVIAPYQPTVFEAYKINVNPQTIDSSLRPREARYDILSRKIMTSFGIDNIKPARVAGEPISKLLPLHIRAGFGNYRTAYGEIFYGNGRSKQWQYGAHLKHRSSQGTFEDYDVPFDNSVNQVELFGEYYGKKIILTKDFYYDRKRHSTYGMNDVFDSLHPDFVKDNLYKRVYTNVGGSVQIADNNTEPNSLNYNGVLNINAFQSNIHVKETSLSFTGDIQHTIDFEHPFFSQSILGFDVFAGWNKLKSDVLTAAQNAMIIAGEEATPESATMFKFHPYGKLRFSGHDFSLGLRMNIFDENSAEVQVVPTIHAKFNLIDNLFAVEFGLDGNAEYSTSKRIAGHNPFLLSNFYPHTEAGLLYKAELHREYYLGLNTALSKTIDFAVKGRLVSYKNLLNFDTEILSGIHYIPAIPTPFFSPTYQDINCFQLQADLNYHLNERIAVSAMGRANSYDEDILYKPKYEANLTARYNMQDKIIVKTQLYFASAIYYHDDEKYNPIVDWSVDIEFRFNRRCSAFMEFNNLLGQRSYPWYNYGTYRMNFLTGVTFNL